MYFNNLHKTLKNNNEAALRYGDGKAWDNKKRKTLNSLAPRGNVFRRLEELESRRRSAEFYQTIHDIKMEVEKKTNT